MNMMGTFSLALGTYRATSPLLPGGEPRHGPTDPWTQVWRRHQNDPQPCDQARGQATAQHEERQLPDAHHATRKVQPADES